MRVLVEHWGEHREFSLGELRGILDGENMPYKIVEDDFPVRVLELEEWSSLRRAGFVRYISAHIFSDTAIPHVNIDMDNFAVRARKYRGSGLSATAVERELGKRIKGRVNLSSPEHVLRVALTTKIHAGVLLHDFSQERYGERTPTSMPVSYPITMHPRYSRALINLARVKRGDRILDPFCGTGAMLIEAALMGFRVEGSDVDARMIRATRTNMKRFGVRAALHQRDVAEIDGSYDAIVTDPPYGRSSSSRGESIWALYDRAFKVFSEHTDRVAIVLPDVRGIEIGKKYFSLVEEFPVRVHKSLTRHYCFFQRE